MMMYWHDDYHFTSGTVADTDNSVPCMIRCEPHKVDASAGLQAALYFLYFLYFNTFPIFPYIVFKCPIIPIFLTSLQENKVFCRLFLHWWMEQRQSFSWPK